MSNLIKCKCKSRTHFGQCCEIGSVENLWLCDWCSAQRCLTDRDRGVKK